MIVIFIDPLKIILKKIFSRLFSGEGKEILTSLYTVDGEAEKQKSVLLEEMGTVLAHEIRNPLGSIKGAAQFLRSEAEDPEKTKAPGDHHRGVRPAQCRRLPVPELCEALRPYAGGGEYQ